MGTMDKDIKCYTCKCTTVDCPGHFGHIELVKPVYHAGLLDFIIKILRCVCAQCSKLLLDKELRPQILKIQNKEGRLKTVGRHCIGVKECKLEAEGCSMKQPKYSQKGLGIMMEQRDERFNTKAENDPKTPLLPEGALRILQNISNDDCILLGLRPEISRPENMIIKNLAVAPPPVRPSAAMSKSGRSEDDLTFLYTMILKTNNSLHVQINKGVNNKTLTQLQELLQYSVATLMDNEIVGQPVQKQKSGKALSAIRSRLVGKKGRLRENLMGKRVDFSARSVITPDPILQLDQLGVPLAIALNLTIPEKVTAQNMDDMRKLISNGPYTWPGATEIHRPDGSQFDISLMENPADFHLEPGYTVERHLRNNDYVIFNRQPSLHKMSIMGHRVKVLPYSTFRLNLSVTTPYNADFDGDEMNMHVPQSYETMAEVKEIMAVPNQIVSPKDNAPVMGIVQDALLGVMLFTQRDNFIEKELVMNLLMWAGYEDEKFPQPAIMRPKALWTGKQIFSLIIPKINMVRGEKIMNSKDETVMINNGELLSGILNKSSIGKSSGGMIHIIWKEKGPEETKIFMSRTQLLINNWLHQNGFTVGVEDIIATKETLDKIKKDFKDNMKKAKQIAFQAQTGQLDQQPGKSMLDTYEFMVNCNLNDARNEAGNYALKNLSKWNRLKAMVTAGSKGSNLNISQIMACVGQQNVEGKRIPFGFSQRTLPHFSKDDYGPASKGFVKNSYLTGLTPQEFFFHAMGGREGLIDTAVKTAETGYIQRRLIKALEDVMVKYDGTVRTSKEKVVQFLYGEDGFAGEYIEDMKINIMNYSNEELENHARLRPKDKNSQEIQRGLSMFMESEIAQEIANDVQLEMRLENEFEQLKQDREDLRHIILNKQDDNKIHYPVNLPRIIWNAKQQFKVKHNSVTDLHPNHILDSLTTLFEQVSTIPGIKVRNDPLLLQARENSTWLYRIYMRSMLNTKSMILKERLTKEAFDWVIGEIKYRFNQAIANPGEMVGSIAAQSIGEPATQMTLNTFHNAGISSKNVTLGVPRINEIINVASNIKTPSMKIYLLPEFRQEIREANSLQAQIEHTSLSHLVSATQIFYDPDPMNTIIQEDEQIIISYNDVRSEEEINKKEKLPPWVVRLEFDSVKVGNKHLTMDKIARKIEEAFQDQINEMHSDDNSEKLVMRLRIKDIYDNEEDEEASNDMYLKEMIDKILNDLTISGIPEISKVTFMKYNETEYDPITGEKCNPKDPPLNWLIETDGVALAKVLCLEKIDFKRTSSNDIQEILRVLGIEAVRLSLINEIRFVLSSYDIYVNYRHLSTLCDVMTQRGILMSVTRNGINRADIGPLRKCSFEETVDILYEAGFYGETDNLSGITENIIMGQFGKIGTGSFDLVVDHEVLQNFVAEPVEDESNGCASSIDPQFPQIIPNTNQQYDPLTQYGQNTPQNHDIISGGNFSPIYRPGLTSQYGGESPLYQQYGMMSPGPQTPPYPPTQARQNNQLNAIITPSYMPGYGTTAQYGRQTPVFGLSGTQNPLGSMGGATASPSYSPTSHYQASPRYSPTNMTPYYNRSLNQNNQPFTPLYNPTHAAQNQFNPPHLPIGVRPQPPAAAVNQQGTANSMAPGATTTRQNVPSSALYSSNTASTKPLYSLDILESFSSIDSSISESESKPNPDKKK